MANQAARWFSCGEGSGQIFIGKSALIGLALAADPENEQIINVVLHL